MSAPTIYEQVPNVKIVLLGESTVGKTSIINVVHGGEYIPDQPTTIGACFYIKKMKVNNVNMKLHIWDTAGQERFRSLAPMYYRDSQYALLVFAVNNEDSFTSIETWHRGLVANCSTMPNLLLIGNKTDLENERVVTAEKGRELAAKINAKYYEISAKVDKASVDAVFEKIAQETVNELQSQGSGERIITSSISVKPQNQKKCC